MSGLPSSSSAPPDTPRETEDAPSSISVTPFVGSKPEISGMENAHPDVLKAVRSLTMWKKGRGGASEILNDKASELGFTINRNGMKALNAYWHRVQIENGNVVKQPPMTIKVKDYIEPEVKNKDTGTGVVSGLHVTADDAHVNSELGFADSPHIDQQADVYSDITPEFEASAVTAIDKVVETGTVGNMLAATASHKVSSLDVTAEVDISKEFDAGVRGGTQSNSLVERSEKAPRSIEDKHKAALWLYHSNPTNTYLPLTADYSDVVASIQAQNFSEGTGPWMRQPVHPDYEDPLDSESDVSDKSQPSDGEQANGPSNSAMLADAAERAGSVSASNAASLVNFTSVERTSVLFDDHSDLTSLSSQDAGGMGED